MSEALNPEPRKPAGLLAQARRAIGDGTSVLVGLQVAQTFQRLLQNLILTRLLTPEAFGLAGVVNALVYIFEMVSDLGLQAYITRHEKLDDDVLDTVWTLRLARNLLLAFGMFAGAPFLAALYENPQIATAIAISGGLFLIQGLASMSYLLAERERRVARVSLIDFARAIAVMIATIIAAYFIRNYWALVIGSFAGAALYVSASYFALPARAPRVRIKWPLAKDLWNFSKYIMPSSILTIFLMQTDKFFMARLFPIEELGKYMIATGIALAPAGLIQQYVRRVFFPRIAAIYRTRPERLPAAYYESRLRMTLVLAFGLGGLIGGADLLIKILFDARYAGAGFYLSLLSLAPLARLVCQPAEQVLVATGFVRATLTGNILRCLWLAIAAPVLYFFIGPIGLVIGAVTTQFVLLPFFAWHLGRRGLLQWSKELAVVVACLAGVAVGAGCNAAALQLIARGLIPDF